MHRHLAAPLPVALLLLTLGVISVFIGVSNVSIASLLNSGEGGRAAHVLVISRIPRTLALMLAGMALATSGAIMQMLARNKFVEPSTTGTVESASLGILACMLFAPGMPLIGKMIVAAIFALAGTALFLRILSFAPLRSPLLVPLIGIMFGGVIGAVATFIAYRFDLLQALNAWMTGDFSGVLRGRYELLWLSLALTAVAYYAADRFTVAGMGSDFTVNLGISHRQVMTLGLIIIAMVTAAVVATVGAIPFLGLIIPNVVSLIMGDNVRRSLPWIAVFGAAFVLACDIVGRLVIYPYEIPIGAIAGIAGSVFFLYLLLRTNARTA